MLRRAADAFWHDPFRIPLWAMGHSGEWALMGSQAGTTLNAMLRDMQKNAKNGAIAIGKTKVALTEADGSYRS